MKEYTTLVFQEKSIAVKRVATYHESKPHEPLVIEFEVYMGPRRIAKLPSLREAMQLVEVGLVDA